MWLTSKLLATQPYHGPVYFSILDGIHCGKFFFPAADSHPFLDNVIFPLVHFQTRFHRMSSANDTACLIGALVYNNYHKISRWGGMHISTHTHKLTYTCSHNVHAHTYICVCLCMCACTCVLIPHTFLLKQAFGWTEVIEPQTTRLGSKLLNHLANFVFTNSMI